MFTAAQRRFLEASGRLLIEVANKRIDPLHAAVCIEDFLANPLSTRPKNPALTDSFEDQVHFKRGKRVYLQRNLTSEELLEISRIPCRRSALKAAVGFVILNQEMGITRMALIEHCGVGPDEISTLLRQHKSQYRCVFGPTGSFEGGPYRFYRTSDSPPHPADT
jgi:hypothetical protein